MPEPLFPLSTEPPLYTLYQNKKRSLLPQIFLLFALGAIFYLGILVNLSLLKLDESSGTIIKISALVILLFLIFAGILMSLQKARQPYLFYRERITFRQKQAPLKEIQQIRLKQNLLDKLFKTYSLLLSKDFRIDNIPQSIPLQDYLQKLVAYAQSL